MTVNAEGLQWGANHSIQDQEGQIRLHQETSEISPPCSGIGFLHRWNQACIEVMEREKFGEGK